MLETAFAYLRLTASIGLGWPFAQWSLDRLLAAALATRREFGVLDPADDDLLGGPSVDEESRWAMQWLRLRSQARWAARETAYYGRLFGELGMESKSLAPEDFRRIPLTTKASLRASPDAFVSRAARPYLRCLTTGTTGRPAAIHFSLHELQTITALSALGFLRPGQLGPEDIVQVSTSSRAALGNLGLLGACARIGAVAYLTGVIAPDQALALLREKRSLPGKKAKTSVLSAYPSYLGQLVEHGLAQRLTPADFGLERILTGGEIVTQGLRQRSRQLFGPVEIVESYALTETIPFGGTLCSQGHLHFELSTGLLEVLAPDSWVEAAPGTPGCLVVTPFPPYRETTLLLRYNTEDMASPIAGRLSCELRHQQATTNLLGKLHMSVRHERGWSYPRDLLEALEVLDEVPLPARAGFWAVPGGVAVEVLVPEDTLALRRKIEASLEAHGLPLQSLRLVPTAAGLWRPLPLRCDLREAGIWPAPEPGMLHPAGAGREFSPLDAALGA